MVDPLGLAIWKMRYGLESVAYKEVRKQLILLYRAKRSQFETQGVVEAIVDNCLHEFMADNCRVCKGATEVLFGELKMTCPECGGLGKHRYSDKERAIFMKMAQERVKHGTRISTNIHWLLNVINTLDVKVNFQMANQLERK